MPAKIVSDEDLRSAIRSNRVEPQNFEAQVRARIALAYNERAVNPWAGLPPILRAAAAFLPLSVLGCQSTPSVARLAPASLGAKLFGYLAFPAISLFVLLGATLLSVVKIRSLRLQNDVPPLDQIVQYQAICRWWSDQKWSACAVFVASLVLAMVGASWLLFLFYILSFGILIAVITSLARLGIGNRLVVGLSCLQGLMFLGQTAAFPSIGDHDIHFLDQSLVPALFFGGALTIAPLLLLSYQFRAVPNGQASRPMFQRRAGFMIVSVLFALILASLTAWMLHPSLWSATPSQIKQYVESFDQVPFGSSTWRQWEIPARWAVQSKLNPDFSKPQQLLAEEISGGQDRYILSSAARVGLLSVDQIDQLREYGTLRHSLVDGVFHSKPQVLTSLGQLDWVIRAAVLRDDLADHERDVIEQRLHATLKFQVDQEYVTLDELLRATQLLNVIKRPVVPDQYRAKIHALLREFHSTAGGGFALAGGFRTYRNSPASMPGAPDATSDAVELMAVYGIPDGLDLNWVRSFLRPSRYSDRKWVAAVTLDRLYQLPNVSRPTWLECLYYERTLLAAAILVGLCLFATFSSPIPNIPNIAGATLGIQQ
jgi:hypothetical protein